MKYHIHSVIVSYNRLDLTRQAISSYLETVSLPFTMVVVDNGSEEHVVEWLLEASANDGRWWVLPLPVNRFPGFATNRGWERMPPETTLLHRGDNDFAYLPGWDTHVVKRMKPGVGQVGLRTAKEEMNARWNVGGNNVIRRRLFDEGLRYDERPWGAEYPPGFTEDSFFTPAVVKAGWEWNRVKKPCIVSLSREDPDDEYYQRTWELRGIKPPGGEAA
jgi:glycosyltransferase involved in cell wall biosynthesis